MFKLFRFLQNRNGLSQSRGAWCGGEVGGLGHGFESILKCDGHPDPAARTLEAYWDRSYNNGSPGGSTVGTLGIFVDTVATYKVVFVGGYFKKVVAIINSVLILDKRVIIIADDVIVIDVVDKYILVEVVIVVVGVEVIVIFPESILIPNTRNVVVKEYISPRFICQKPHVVGMLEWVIVVVVYFADNQIVWSSGVVKNDIGTIVQIMDNVMDGGHIGQDIVVA